MNIWRPIDGIANWLRHELGAAAQLRLGVLCVLLSLPLMVYGFWSGEPLLIYLMSAFALTLTGVGIIIGAEVLANSEDANK